MNLLCLCTLSFAQILSYDPWVHKIFMQTRIIRLTLGFPSFLLRGQRGGYPGLILRSPRFFT